MCSRSSKFLTDDRSKRWKIQKKIPTVQWIRKNLKIVFHFIELFLEIFCWISSIWCKNLITQRKTLKKICSNLQVANEHKFFHVAEIKWNAIIFVVGNTLLAYSKPIIAKSPEIIQNYYWIIFNLLFQRVSVSSDHWRHEDTSEHSKANWL